MRLVAYLCFLMMLLFSATEESSVGKKGLVSSEKAAVSGAGIAGATGAAAFVKTPSSDDSPTPESAKKASPVVGEEATFVAKEGTVTALAVAAATGGAAFVKTPKKVPDKVIVNITNNYGTDVPTAPEGGKIIPVLQEIGIRSPDIRVIQEGNYRRVMEYRDGKPFQCFKQFIVKLPEEKKWW